MFPDQLSNYFKTFNKNKYAAFVVQIHLNLILIMMRKNIISTGIYRS